MNGVIGMAGSPPPSRGRVRVGGDVVMKSETCIFPHPLTPSRKGRGDFYMSKLGCPLYFTMHFLPYMGIISGVFNDLRV